MQEVKTEPVDEQESQESHCREQRLSPEQAVGAKRTKAVRKPREAHDVEKCKFSPTTVLFSGKVLTRALLLGNKVGRYQYRVNYVKIS